MHRAHVHTVYIRELCTYGDLLLQVTYFVHLLYLNCTSAGHYSMMAMLRI